MKREMLGGPLLGQRGSCNKATLGRRFEPIITPVVGRSNSAATTAKTEQFILLPQEQFIDVLAFKTGRAVAKLVPFSKESGGKVESICLATHPGKPRNAIDIFDKIQTDNAIESQQRKSAKKRRTEQEGLEDHVALVGCSDGTIREFPLLALLASSYWPARVPQDDNCGRWELSGACYGPRRIFKVTVESTSIRHLTAPPVVLTPAEYGLLAYALVEQKVQHGNKSGANEGLLSFRLVRLTLPPYFDDCTMVSKSEVIPLYPKTEKIGSRVKVVGKLSCEKQARGVAGGLAGSEPFCLESLVRDSTQGFLSPDQVHFRQQKNLFIIVGRPTATHVFCERLADIGIAPNHYTKDLLSVTYRNDGKNPFCSLAVSLNKNDIAFGHESGDIVSVPNFLSQVEEYHAALAKYERQVGAQASKDEKTNSAVGLMKPDYPFKNAVEARMHWHAHPVATLCYDANSSPTDPILYSGGEESVLITWQQSRGISRPADVLPRIARQGICFIGCSKRPFNVDATDVNDTVLVFCEDNSLQLFETHSKRLLWKVQGVAAIKRISPQGMSLHGSNDFSLAHDTPLATMDPTTHGGPSPLLILNGIPDAPGVVQWYDIAKHRVVSHLEVAPCNRVSGTEYMEKVPMPAPLVTHVAFSSSGSDLLTIEQVATENLFVGPTGVGSKNGDVNFGFVTTVKFWVWDHLGVIQRESNESNRPYQLAAAMTRPHGAENKVSAIAMSSDGRFACTASNGEKAFRLWRKVATGGEEGRDSSRRRLPVWSCQYKITTPTGYSNYTTGVNAIAFSSDSSILAICYGHMLTLWDRCNMTLLTSNHHFDEEDIDSVEFLKTDMILCKSQSGVSIQSPFGAADLGEVSWCWTVLDKPASVVVSRAHYVVSHDIVAIAIYYGYLNTSRIVLVNATSGDPVKGQEGAIIERVPGVVCSIGHMGGGKVKSKWRDEDNTSSKLQSPLVLFALTSEGLLMSLREGSASEDCEIEVHPLEVNPHEDSSTTIPPCLPGTAYFNHKPAKRRRRTGSKLQHLDPRVHDRKVSMVNFGSSSEVGRNDAPLPTSSLPLLGGGFARDFVGRNLSRKREGSSQ